MHRLASWLRPLRPSWWACLVLAPLWAFRGLEAWGRFRAGAALGPAHLIAFVWDLPIALGLLWLARLWAPQRSGASRVLATLAVRITLTGLVAWDLALRAADVVYGSASGGYFNATAFTYLKRRNAALLGDGDLPKLCAMLLLGSLFVGLGLWLDARVVAQRSMTEVASPASTLPRALLAFSFLCLPFLVGWNAVESSAYRFAPESLFVREWLLWRGLLDTNDASALKLSAAMTRRFVELGLLPAQPLNADFPLTRARIESMPFPYPKLPGTVALPNVVFTLVEQLNHDFVTALSGELPGAMPELSALVQRTSVVTDYQSITQPTIHALVASLCSIHMSAPTKQLHDRLGGEALERTALRCLPDILRARGFRTVYIQSGDNQFAGTAGFLRAHGFEELYGKPELSARFPNAQSGRWGLHDDVLIQFAEEKIRALEQERAAGGRPFFVMVQTIDSHYPGHAPPDCALPAQLERQTDDGNSRRMLRALHCTDRALGGFARFILDDPQRAATTLWAMTGDHPTWSGARFVVDLYKKRGREFPGFCARLPLFLHDPLHALPARIPVLSGHLDLAPTLLHMLGIVDVPNAMTGYSIFGTRPKFPVLFGRMPPERVAVYRPGHTESATPSELLSMCAQKRGLIHGDPKALTACELLAFMQFEDALWKYKRLFPRQ
jgi:arylsulfatase A-like enzyme